MAYSITCSIQTGVRGLAKATRFSRCRYLASHYFQYLSLHLSYSAAFDNKQWLATKIDPRLRTFLLEVKEKFDTSGCLSMETNVGKMDVDAHHIQAISGLAGKLIQAENDFNELKALSESGNFVDTVKFPNIIAFNIVCL